MKFSSRFSARVGLLGGFSLGCWCGDNGSVCSFALDAPFQHGVWVETHSDPFASPCMFAPAADHCGNAWKKNGDGQDLLEASVRFGVFLTMDNLKLLCARLGAEPVAPGSGKRGNIIKIDYAKALVKKMFPDLDMDSAEAKRMIQAITWQSSKKLNEDEKKILDYVAELDEENRECPEFKRVAKLAKQELHTVEREKMEAELRQKLREEASLDEVSKKRRRKRLQKQQWSQARELLAARKVCQRHLLVPENLQKLLQSCDCFYMKKFELIRRSTSLVMPAHMDTERTTQVPLLNFSTAHWFLFTPLGP